MINWRCWTSVCLVVLCLMAATLSARAQDQADGAAEAGADAKQEMVIFNLPENTSLKTLTDFVAARLKLNIVHDALLDSKKITLKTSTPVPLDSLRPMLESLLEINGMILVETDVKGILRVMQANKIAELSGPPLNEGEAPPKGKAVPVVSQVYKIKHSSVKSVSELLLPFMNTAKGAKIIQLPRNNMLIVTDFVSNLERIERVLKLADQPGQEVVTRFVKIENLGAAELSKQVTELLKAREKVRGGDEQLLKHTLISDDRTNQIIVAARPSEIADIEQIIQSLDVSLGLTTKIYRLSVVEPEYLDEIIREMLGAEKAARLYKGVPEESGKFLAVTSTPEIIQEVDAMVAKLDMPVAEEQSPIRFYKLEHAEAKVVAEALGGITGGQGLESLTIDGVSSLDGSTFSDLAPPASPLPAGTPSDIIQSGQGGPGTSSGIEGAKVLAYEPMNTLIVIAPPTLQPVYEKLIKRLDTRRPQVLIEATVVALDTTNNFSLGVEFRTNDSVNGGSLLNFSQFGLGLNEIDLGTTATPGTGSFTNVVPSGAGFNGVLLDANIAEVVVQALKSDVRSSVLTRPSVLVNDNAEGELETIDTEPFESVNTNSSNTTTASLGGELESGTKITVKPSISEGGFLKLNYGISISSFVGERIETSAGGTLPPARSENNISSEVTIPDGSMIVVGGLTREIDSEKVQRVPILGEIPILEYAFSNRSNSKREITLFVFIRPVILHDDKFEDLKMLSATSAGKAMLPAAFPESLPVEIR